MIKVIFFIFNTVLNNISLADSHDLICDGKGNCTTEAEYDRLT